MTRDVIPERAISGHQLTDMVDYAARWLERNVAAINAINVFPVPDGDTGSNMSATMNAAVHAARGVPNHAGRVLAAIADGALLGARGNSGVILSQILAGLAEQINDADELNAMRFATALIGAEAAARSAVTEPKPGTILTVLADTARAAVDAARSDTSLATIMSVAAEAAAESVQRTPDLLPLLREAGVVDAGGAGLATILDGCRMYLRGEPMPDEPTSPALEEFTGIGRQPAPGHGADAPSFGYCTEFIVEAEANSRGALLEELRPLGESLLVVNQGRRHRVHIHTQDPGAALSVGVRHGLLARVKVESMEVQHAVAASRPTAEAVTTTPASVVAIALGAGFEELLRGYGAAVIPGGQTMNPSTAEILDAINATPGDEVYLLPDNPNLFAAAEQAARIAAKPVHVVRTTSIPQGIAALLAFNPQRGPTENEAAMAGAAAAVHTVEVTRAARAATVGGVHAEKGQPVALVDGRLAAAGETAEDVALATLARLPGGETATIYFGGSADQSMAEALATALRAVRPDLGVEVVPGGQPHYDYVVSLE